MRVSREKDDWQMSKGLLDQRLSMSPGPLPCLSNGFNLMLITNLRSSCLDAGEMTKFGYRRCNVKRVIWSSRDKDGFQSGKLYEPHRRYGGRQTFWCM